MTIPNARDFAPRVARVTPREQLKQFVQQQQIEGLKIEPNGTDTDVSFDRSNISPQSITEHPSVQKYPLISGAGAPATTSSTVAVRYVIRESIGHRILDDLHGRKNSTPLTIDLGEDQLPSVMEESLLTMREGDVCIITSPPNLFPLLSTTHENSIEIRLELVSVKDKSEEKVYDDITSCISDVEDMRKEGNEHFKSKSWDKAEITYLQAMEKLTSYDAQDDEEASTIDRNRFPLLTNLSAVLLKREDYRRAEVYAREAVKLDGNSAKAQWRLGQSLMEQGRLEEARECLVTAAKLEPKDVSIRKDVKEVLEMMKIEREMEKLRPNGMRGMFK
ncbi:peptidyl-prolyl isomerase PASTICCINO1-like [Planoprotostelium fungivorum]|uniref:Peptidyl-prolyl isomerase PASTICCINO1-like n=1 Tax=Planoprotostelium fungivorum TaxID=1890364 RepID=A0A2P6ND22_9EUKA|nr:peptidyl-prolyl isomerase PASTICCINO1-like [Planoprotostelium fungivorum]